MEGKGNRGLSKTLRERKNNGYKRRRREPKTKKYKGENFLGHIGLSACGS